jgi:hypothetical protein
MAAIFHGASAQMHVCLLVRKKMSFEWQWKWKHCNLIQFNRITNSPVADVFLVWAKCDDDEIRGFILEKVREIFMHAWCLSKPVFYDTSKIRGVTRISNIVNKMSMQTYTVYTSQPFPSAKGPVTLHNDNDTITCIRALIGQKCIVIVRLKKIARVSDFKIVIVKR